MTEAGKSETKETGLQTSGDLLVPPINRKLQIVESMDERCVQWVMDKLTLLDGRHKRNHNVTNTS